MNRRFILFAIALGTTLYSGSVQAQELSSRVGGIDYERTAPLQARETPKFDTKQPPSGPGAALSYAVTFQGAGGVSVPGLLSRPARVATGARQPAVLLLHGLGGDKSQMALLGLMLSRLGYITLSIDAAGHGERPMIGGKPVNALSLAEMRTLSGQTVQDLRRAVDYLQSRPDVDSQKIGFVGVSLGGILGARFLAEEPRLACASLWAAGGDWGKLLSESQHPWAKGFRERGATNAEKIEAELMDVDPLKAIGKAVKRPVQFINGDKDDVVPVVCTKLLIAATNEPKEIITLPGGHIPNILEMAKQTISFLQKNINAPKATPPSGSTPGAPPPAHVPAE